MLGKIALILDQPASYGCWMQINQNFLRSLPPARMSVAEVLRVFLYLNARLEFENLIQVPQVEIADELGMHKQAVSRAIKQLEALGIIIRGPGSVGRAVGGSTRKPAGRARVIHLREAQRQQLSEIVK